MGALTTPEDPAGDGSIGKAGFLAVALAALGLVALSVVGTAHSRQVEAHAPLAFWIVVGLIAAAAVAAAVALARLPLESAAASKRRIAVPAVLGLTTLFLWETIAVAAGAPSTAAPIAILVAAWRNAGALAAQAGHTALTTALPGWLAGCAAGALVAFGADRLDLLRRLTPRLAAVAAGVATAGAAPAIAGALHAGAAPWAATALVVFAGMLLRTSAGLAAKRAPSDAATILFAGLKLGAVVAVAAAVAAEAFGGPSLGLGADFQTDLAHGDLNRVGARVATAGAAAAAVYALGTLAERVVVRPRGEERPR